MTAHCDRLHAYVDDELDDAAATAYETHLATCAACGAELPRMLDLLAALEAATRAGSRPARLTAVAGRPIATQLEDSRVPVSAPDH